MDLGFPTIFNASVIRYRRVVYGSLYGEQHSIINSQFYSFEAKKAEQGRITKLIPDSFGRLPDSEQAKKALS